MSNMQRRYASGGAWLSRKVLEYQIKNNVLFATRSDAAREFGIAHQQWINWIDGKHRPLRTTVISLAAKLGVSRDEALQAWGYVSDSDDEVTTIPELIELVQSNPHKWSAERVRAVVDLLIEAQRAQGADSETIRLFLSTTRWPLMTRAQRIAQWVAGVMHEESTGALPLLRAG